MLRESISGKGHVSQGGHTDLPGEGTVVAHWVHEGHWKSSLWVLVEAVLTEVPCLRTLGCNADVKGRSQVPAPRIMCKKTVQGRVLNSGPPLGNCLQWVLGSQQDTASLTLCCDVSWRECSGEAATNKCHLLLANGHCWKKCTLYRSPTSWALQTRPEKPLPLTVSLSSQSWTLGQLVIERDWQNSALLL